MKTNKAIASFTNSGDSKYYGLSKVTVGISDDSSVEVVAPQYDLVTFDGVDSLECGSVPEFNIIRMDDMGDNWTLLYVQVPFSITDCEVDEYEFRYFISHPTLGVFEYPKGYAPTYSYPHYETGENGLIIMKPRTARNDRDNPFIVSDSTSEGRGIYQITLPKEGGEVPKLKLVVPNLNNNTYFVATFGLENSFTAIKDGYIYFLASQGVLQKIAIDTGRIIDTWQHEYVNAPFYFKGLMYVGIGGDNVVELLADGKFGVQLQLPTYSNSYYTSHIIDDRYIIGDRCAVSDMDTNTGIHLNYGGDGNGEVRVENNVVYCVGLSSDYTSPTKSMGAVSMKLGDVKPLQEVSLPNTNLVKESIRLRMPFINYESTENSVFETDTVSVNMITGEKFIETYYYDGEKVQDFIPIN
ncbi:hypothetical protein [Shewanella marina]|uniref:hypothetical protein n=1 Tax=Shewanella marina TaxID=487319 RepID=UPI00046E87C1|nr:hypothetical protein [Shewanella marina]